MQFGALRAPDLFRAEAGARAAGPFPAPLSPLAALFLRYAPDRFLLGKPNTFLHNRDASVATLRWCSGSSRLFRNHPGFSVRLGRNPHLESALSFVHQLVYTLTRICSVEYIKRVESVFEIIAEPNRRAILSLLVSSQQSVGDIERQLHMPQPTVSKHLRVLREAGFVESTVDAQRRLYRLKPEPFQEVDAWLAPFRRFWSAHVDALERHLDRMEQITQTKKKTRRRR